MGFDIKPGMSCWNSMSQNYKKEYHIYASKMEKRKFENDRKMIQKERNQKLKEKIFKGELNKTATIQEKQWFDWMN